MIGAAWLPLMVEGIAGRAEIDLFGLQSPGHRRVGQQVLTSRGDDLLVRIKTAHVIRMCILIADHDLVRRGVILNHTAQHLVTLLGVHTRKALR